ncbi:WxL domain-containing protein [Schleiferilactobacillus shenzhenensis]|uniref:Uncharacterized protein n=1 Tax=Schleiferilactobacillus shenzhenensis LY-73 TaxID=1231336 RepID=U4THR2_9LACO|nr:WxL domain-containing protein [Schleiferilactobacillus shenzhenensis]ERL63709.1 hypothetical protein L248_2249 [Schleiferilactobacillus shenzhenensis LY-73]
MRKGFWGVSIAALAALTGAAVSLSNTQYVHADSDSASGTASVEFTGGTSLLEVPNFDFGVQTIGGGELYPLLKTINSTSVAPSTSSRVIMVESTTAKGTGTTPDGWKVSVGYVKPDGATNTMPADAALVFTSNSIGEYSSDPDSQAWYNGVVTDIGKEGSVPDSHWKVNNYTGDVSASVVGAGLPGTSVTTGVLPFNSTTTTYSLFGRDTNAPDVSLINQLDLSGSATMRYQYNFNQSKSAYIYVPRADQKIDQKNIGTLQWTLSPGVPGNWS